jgi:hypothetical protein
MRHSQAMTAKQLVIECELSAVRALRMAEDVDVRIEAAQREKQLVAELRTLLGERVTQEEGVLSS